MSASGPPHRTRRALTGAVALLLLAVGAQLGPGAAGAQATTPPPPPATPTFGPWIDQASSYEAPSQCLSTVQPGVQLLQDLLRTTYGRTSFGTVRACSGGTATSEHNEGRALDFMLDVANPADVAVAQSFLGWLLATDAQGHAFANARRLGVMYLIWDKQMWRAYDPVWRPYTGSSEHTDHIHISLSWEGALLQTSFWRPDLSTDCDPAQPVCPLATEKVDVYTTPGYHVSSGRLWRTTCEPYGQATRCRTEIKATTVVPRAGGGWTTAYQFVFNNLTYIDQWSPVWDANILAQPGDHTSSGYRWRVTCVPDATTGPRICTDYIWTSVMAKVGASYVKQTGWRYNDVVRLSAPAPG